MLETLRNLAVAKLPGDSARQSARRSARSGGGRTQAARECRRQPARPDAPVPADGGDAGGDYSARRIPTCCSRWRWCRMATIAPVIDADELLRAIGAAGSRRRTRGRGGPPLRRRRRHATTEGRGRGQGAGPAAPRRSMQRRWCQRRRATRERRRRPESHPPTLRRRADIPELRDYIRRRRAALAGFMEQGAALSIDGDIATRHAAQRYIRALSQRQSGRARRAGLRDCTGAESRCRAARWAPRQRRR